MSEKRFTGEFDKQYGGVYDNGEQLTNFEVVDLLNEFDEKYIDELNLRETLQQELRRVENENEQLKKVFNEMIRLYSGTFIFTTEEFYFIRKIMEMD